MTKNKNIPKKELLKQLPQLKQAAQRCLDRGWYLFPCAPGTKIPFAGTHGSSDAVNTLVALAKWEAGEPANPGIRLDKSGLTVLDIDHGLPKFSIVHSFEAAEAWAKAHGLPETYIVSSGRGYHFYFAGIRAISDCIRNRHSGKVGFDVDGVSGDIKCHGHVIAEGGLHSSGRVYRSNDRAVALLPDWIRDYEDPVVKQRREQFNKPIVPNNGLTSSLKISAPVNTQVVVPGKRYAFLRSEAGHLRRCGLNRDAIRLGLRDICNRFCVNGENYPDSKLTQLADWLGSETCHRTITHGTKIGRNTSAPAQDKGMAALLREEFGDGRVVTIHTIMEQIALTFPDPPRTTVDRAMKLAGFMIDGKDPKDRRKVLWRLIASRE